ncbi:MAG TPA: NACHT domain-containing protein, partial [Methylomirabilota bacterium]|nr:NACHT domain-containing protein [Methylomirabilota bacterium]
MKKRDKKGPPINGWHKFEQFLNEKYKNSLEYDYNNVWLKQEMAKDIHKDWRDEEIANPIPSYIREEPDPPRERPDPVNDPSRLSGHSSMKAPYNPETLIRYEQRKLEYRVYENLESEQSTYQHLEMRSIIRGRPGAGKTHYLKRLALYLLQNKNAEQRYKLFCKEFWDIDLPIYVDLQKFARSDELMQEDGLLEFIVSQWHAQCERKIDGDVSKHDAEKYIREKMRRGNVLLLLDELDKTKHGIANEQARQQFDEVIKAIDKLVNECDEKSLAVVIVIAKRYLLEEMHLPGFNYIGIIEDLRLEDIHTFIGKYGGSPENKIKLLDTLDSNLRLQAIMANPYTLRHIIQTPGTLLSSDRPPLYKSYTDAYIEKAGAAKAHLLSEKDIRQIIKQIAWEMHSRGEYVLLRY